MFSGKNIFSKCWSGKDVIFLPGRNNWKSVSTKVNLGQEYGHDLLILEKGEDSNQNESGT